jgi:cobaltochelatase CobN
MSVDLYVEQVIAGARIAIRLLGGLDYWRYGAEEIAHAAVQGIQLALLPGDGRRRATRRAIDSRWRNAGAARCLLRRRRSAEHAPRA